MSEEEKNCLPKGAHARNVRKLPRTAAGSGTRALSTAVKLRFLARPRASKSIAQRIKGMRACKIPAGTGGWYTHKLNHATHKQCFAKHKVVKLGVVVLRWT